MPRRVIGERPPRTNREIVERLKSELQNNQQTGQPLIYEQQYDGERIRSTVVWDDWAGISLEERSSVILEAYSEAFGAPYPNNVVLATGLTVPEAESAGMLPFRIIPALRNGDRVTPEECRAAMIEVGASTLQAPLNPQLRFATSQEAEAAIEELVNRLPHSRPVWIVTQDVGRVDDWLAR